VEVLVVSVVLIVLFDNSVVLLFDKFDVVLELEAVVVFALIIVCKYLLLLMLLLFLFLLAI
jgi:hypothetical protein